MSPAAEPAALWHDRVEIIKVETVVEVIRVCGKHCQTERQRKSTYPFATWQNHRAANGSPSVSILVKLRNP